MAARAAKWEADGGSAGDGNARAQRARSTRPQSADTSEERREVTVHEAKTHLSRLLADVEAGGTVVITRRGKPVAQLQAVEARPRRVFGSMKGQFTIDDSFFDPLPEDELRLWEGR